METGFENATTTGYAPDTISPYLVAASWVWKIGGSMIIFVGTFGNGLLIAVFCRPNMRKVSLSVYFTALGIIDITCLYVVWLPSFMKYALEMNVRKASTTSCKVLWFALYYLSDLSVWTLVLLNIDRAISISAPFSRFRCGKRSAFINLAVAGVILFLINFHWLIGMQLGTQTTPTCILAGEDEYLYFVYDAWQLVDFTKYCLLPVAIISACDVAIFISIRNTKRNLSNVEGDNPEGRNSGGNPSRPSSITVMLIAADIQLIITTMPLFLAFIIQQTDSETLKWPKAQLILSCTELLNAANHSLNFFTYCMCGRKFRGELVAMISRDIPHQERVRGSTGTDLTTVKRGTTVNNLTDISPQERVGGSTETDLTTVKRGTTVNN